MSMSWGTKIKKKKAKEERKPGFNFRGKRSTYMMLEVVPWAREQHIS